MNIKITQGQNVIQILYDEFVSCLKIKQALAVNWPDCAGSVGEYYAVSIFNSELRQSLTNELNSALLNGTEEQIYNSLKSFLNLFENGDYRLTKGIIPAKNYILCHEESIKYGETVPMEERFSGWFYPYPFDKEYLIFTRPKKSINHSRIEHYCNLIKNGERPKVLLYNLFSIETSNETATYILDGHHKLLAYKKLEIETPIIRVTRIEKSPNRTTEILESSHMFLKRNELSHLILENDENIENVNFLDNPLLTQKLDEAIMQSKRPGIGIIKLFLKVSAQNSEKSKKWISDRIKSLRMNKYIGKGLSLNTKVLNEKKEIEHWDYFEVNNVNNLDEWIKKTLPNNG